MSRIIDCLLIFAAAAALGVLGGCESQLSEKKANAEPTKVNDQQTEQAAEKGKQKQENKQEKKEETKNQVAEKDEKKEKPFDEVVKDHKVIEGLLTLYVKEDEGKVYLEIKPDQFDKVFLCSITREAADGYFFDSAAMLDRFPFVFKRVGKKVLFVHKNVYFRADKDTAISRAVSRGVSDSIVGSATIESKPHPQRGSILVDPAAFFIQDIGMVAYILGEYFKEAGYSFDKDTSYFGVLKSFEENTEIEAVLHFKSGKPVMMPTVPDPRSFQHVYHYSISSLPQTDYQPRLGDDRVGHFLTMYQDYTSVMRDTPYVRHINRWHLEKAEPKFKKSRPKKPIVFWLENTIPVEYRDAVKEGVLLWNKAFERIGFEDAIVVRQQPDDADWDPADARYSTVRWIVQPGAGYAVGPSRTNPFTGQIYDADIRISADILRYIFMQYEELAKPIAAGDLIARKIGILGDFLQGYCDYQIESAQEAAFGWSLLSARGLVDESNEVDMAGYVHDYLVHLVAHEVGHTLGLRHNFKASSVLSAEQIQDAKLTSEKGLTGSLMDYVPTNIAPEGQKQGQYFQTSLGPYDYWSIEYAYKPVDPYGSQSEKAMLAEIASRCSEAELTYGTDEDAFQDARGIDPACSWWDLGDDPIKYYQGRAALAKELFGKVEGEFEKEGNRYQKLRQVFNQGIRQYRAAAMNMPKYIGGIYHRRDHVGDPNGRIPFEPVPPARQRQALHFLQEHVFGPEAFEFTPQLLNKLAPERFWDFEWSVWRARQINYPIHETILSIQKWILDNLYHPVRLARLIDVELHYSEGEKPFTMADMFEGLRKAIWSELSAPGSDINSFRRGLQRLHLDKLAALVVDPVDGVPEDASTLARYDLVSLKAGIDRSLSRGTLDAYTRAHLEETSARIEAVLKAGIERRIRSVSKSR